MLKIASFSSIVPPDNPICSLGNGSNADEGRILAAMEAARLHLGIVG